MYLVPFDAVDMLWPKGIQFQIKDGATGDFVLLQDVTIFINGVKTQAGSSVVVKRIKDASKADDEWNSLVVTVQDGVISQYLNGQLVNQGNHPSVSEGRILLQYEGYPIDFRKVKILPLP